jgi:hypothetical protein
MDNISKVEARRTPNPLAPLSEAHKRTLLEESAISTTVVAGRGYWTATRRQCLVGLVKAYQRRVPALVVPVYSPDGETTTLQVRPDRPRVRDGKAIRYETPADSRCILDVHPSMHDSARKTSEDLWITEGIKKGDSLTSRGRCTVSLIGVWNWQRGGEMLSCWDHVALEGRRVYVVFDSDVMVKPEVQLALERLVAALERRGAEVLVVYLPGPEKGVDDYLAAGGTVEQLEELARPYRPEAFGRIRLSRDEQLRALVEDLEATLWRHEWKGIGGYSARDVFVKLVEAAARCGKPHASGVRVEISHRTLAERAKVSARTLWKAIGRLEEAGLAQRDNAGRKADKTGSFVLRASVRQVVQREDTAEAASRDSEAYDRGDLHLRAPRLRWSAPKRTIRRGLVRGTRKVRSGARQHRSGRKRLGKIRGSVLDALDVAGGERTVAELCEVLHRSRPRDLRRRVLLMLEEAAIITVEGDVVRLTDNWLEALDRARELGRELEAERMDRARHQRQREAFRRRRELQVSRHWVNAGEAADGGVEDLQRIGRLSPADTRILEAIKAFEEKYGRGSFRWDRASCKEMFYSGPIRGCWPDPEELARVRAYVEATGGLEVAA